MGPQLKASNQAVWRSHGSNLGPLGTRGAADTLHHGGLSCKESCVDPEGDRGPDPLKNHKNIGFLAILVRSPGTMEKSPSQHSMLGPSLACQQNAIKMAFRWWADDCPLIVVFGFSYPSTTKKTNRKRNNIVLSWTPSKKSRSAHEIPPKAEPVLVYSSVG